MAVPKMRGSKQPSSQQSKPTYRWFLLCVVTMLIGVFIGSQLRMDTLSARESVQANPYAKLDTFAQVLAQIESSYVEDLDGDALVYGAIKGMVRTLDPHSSFLTPDELRALRSRTAGQYVGVGIEIGMREDRVTIIAPMPGGPAAEAGVRAGDVIMAVDGNDARTWDIQAAAKHLRGPEGSTVEIRVLRPAENKEYTFIVERRIVELLSVEHKMLEPGYGYVVIRSFTQDVSADLRASYDALTRANKGDLDGLILDLRNNPGGLLREAILVANAFLRSGLIVSTEGRKNFELARYDASSSYAFVQCPVVVLVNGGSASASEIVAGALQDHKRAVIVGTQTFGKGSVQNIYDLDDQSGLKLTVARYFTPAHRSIQALGVTPDIVAEDVMLPEAESTDTKAGPREEDLPGALEGDGGPDVDEAPVEQIRDLPLRTALDQLKAFQILSQQP